MSLLFFSLAVILVVYFLSVFFIMKRVLTWKYKALIYGTLTFFMLISVFIIFSHYDKNWKEYSIAAQESLSGRPAK